jgi:hypothetical protein
MPVGYGQKLLAILEGLNQSQARPMRAPKSQSDAGRVGNITPQLRSRNVTVTTASHAECPASAQRVPRRGRDVATKHITQVEWHIPTTVYKEVAHTAHAERRTINAQAATLLTEALESRKEIADALRDHVWYAKESKRRSSRRFDPL